MYDLHVHLPNRPGALADFGEAMGARGVSLEGGGVFTVDGVGHAHFLVKDGATASAAAEAAGLTVATIRPVVVCRLDQNRPGQLGAVAPAVHRTGVNILTQYSDHANQLVLVTDDPDAAALATAPWAAS